MLALGVGLPMSVVAGVGVAVATDAHAAGAGAGVADAGANSAWQDYIVRAKKPRPRFHGKSSRMIIGGDYIIPETYLGGASLCGLTLEDFVPL